MTVNPRRPGFRLPWSDDTPETDQPANGAEGSASPSGDAEAGALGAEMSSSTGAQAPADAPAGSPGAAVGEPPADSAADLPAELTAGEEAPASDEFLHNLVAAMRGVAEESRDANLADLRRGVDERIEHLRATSAERAEELRRVSDVDIAATADWEKAEMDRVRTEAERRVAARRAELERQLADHRTASEREIEATRRQLADYERELTEFFDQLAEIRDPAAFVAAAKRMPRGPELPTTTMSESPAPAPPASDTSSAAPAEAPTGDVLAELAAQRASMLSVGDAEAEQSGAEAAPEEAATSASDVVTAEATAPEAAAPEAAAPEAAAPEADEAYDTANARLAERLAELNQRLSHTGSNGESAPVATAAEATPAPPSTEAAAPGEAEETDGEMSTPIMVKGLGSFGAITSFKQALERADGIRGVTLSLGPGGEFVYRASHAPGFDLVAAIRAIEGHGASIDETNGSLLVTINRGR